MGKCSNVEFLYGNEFHSPYNVSIAYKLALKGSTCFFQDFEKRCKRAVLFIVF